MAINSYEVDSSQGMNRIAQAADYIKNKADNDALLKHQEARQNQLISDQNTRQDQLRTEDQTNRRKQLMNERKFGYVNKVIDNPGATPEQKSGATDAAFKMMSGEDFDMSEEGAIRAGMTAEEMVEIPEQYLPIYKKFLGVKGNTMPKSNFERAQKVLDAALKNQELRLKNKGHESDLKTDQGRRALLRAQTAGANARANETNRKTERDSELTESQQRAKIIGQLREYGPKSLSKEELKLIRLNDSGDLLKLAEEHRSNLNSMKMMDKGNTEGIATLQAKYDDIMAEVEKRAGIKGSRKSKKENSEGFDDLENYLDGYAGE